MIGLGAIVIDSGTGDVWLGFRRARLTAYEFELFRTLLRTRSRSVPAETLRDQLHQLQPYCDWPAEHTVVVQISYLRRKLNQLGIVISNTGEGGYRLDFQSRYANRRAA
jgi:DNA-binding response OmpR family regulator